MKRAEEKRNKIEQETAAMRDRLHTEFDREKLRKMFQENEEYFSSIWSGKIYSSRHQDFHGSREKRDKLRWRMILDPFQERHYDWVQEEINRVCVAHGQDQEAGELRICDKGHDARVFHQILHGLL